MDPERFCSPFGHFSCRGAAQCTDSPLLSSKRGETSKDCDMSVIRFIAAGRAWAHATPLPVRVR